MLMPEDSNEQHKNRNAVIQDTITTQKRQHRYSTLQHILYHMVNVKFNVDNFKLKGSKEKHVYVTFL